MNRRSGEEEVPNAVDFKLARFGDVVADELKAQVFQTLEHVGLMAGENVVLSEQLFTSMHQGQETKSAFLNCPKISKSGTLNRIFPTKKIMPMNRKRVK